MLKLFPVCGGFCLLVSFWFFVCLLVLFLFYWIFWINLLINLLGFLCCWFFFFCFVFFPQKINAAWLLSFSLYIYTYLSTDLRGFLLLFNFSPCSHLHLLVFFCKVTLNLSIRSKDLACKHFLFDWNTDLKHLFCTTDLKKCKASSIPKFQRSSAE